MKKLRTLDDLENFISREFSWRRKELTNLRNLSLSARKTVQSSLLRLSLTALYAHWEGFIKSSSRAYIEYLTSQGVPYYKLNKNFQAFALMEHYSQPGISRQIEFTTCMDFLDLSRVDMHRSFKVDSTKYIEAKANLKSDVLRDIVQKLGISYEPYELKSKYIDETFVGLRNAICHGEYRELRPEEFDEIYAEITSLMEVFKGQLLNCTYQKSYLIDRNS